MAFAITQSCCSDASCVAVCPVNCIHPTPEEPDFATAEMLYIDPRSCIDCGACADACPVDAIRPVDLLTGGDEVYVDINRDHYVVAAGGAGGGAGGVGDADASQVDDEDWTSRWQPPHFPAALTPAASGLRVAVVGSGPAASYTAAELLTTSARVTMVERLPVAGGLIRFGVAPDHPSTRAIGRRFDTLLRHPRLTMLLDTEVGRDISHAELLAHHDAVVYAVGASADRGLGVPGEDLVGSLSARTFVAWYNGHPETAVDAVDLAAARRVVIVGNGNVALDAARILLADPETLARTDISVHALAALRESRVREVVLVARRGPGQAAYSLAEIRPLLAREDLDVVVDGDAGLAAAIRAAAPDERAGVLRDVPVREVDWDRPVEATARRRLVLRFDTVVERVLGDGLVDGVCLRPSAGGPEAGPAVRVSTELLLRSVGYRSEPLADLPFDEATHTVPHREGRVVDPASGDPLPATYVVGWVKRGPSGGIGSNRGDAAETVASLVADANAGRLGIGRGSDRALRRLLRRRRSARTSAG